MVKINNNNSINHSKSLRFGEQTYTMPAYSYDNRYLQTIQQPQLPDIYNADDSDKPSFKESFAEGPAGMFFKPWIEHPIATLGTFIGLGFGMDWFAKKCGGEYEQSIVGKVAKFGDKVQNSSFVQSAPMKKTGNFLSSTKEKIKKFLGKSDALKAANEMSVQPESQNAKGMLTYTAADEIVQEFSHHISGSDGIGLNAKDFGNPIKLKNLYVDRDVEKFIKDTYGKSYKEIKHTAEAEKIANHIVLKRLGVEEGEISSIINGAEGTLKTKAKVLEIMGKDLKEPLTPELLQKISENPKEYRDTVKKIAENTKGKIWTAAGDYEWMGPVKRFFKRKISMDGISNKFQSIAKDSGHTSTGRVFSKALQTMYRGFTFGGGKLGAFIFIAPGLVEMAINTKKADKDKKIGTATWGFINAVSWPITFMLGGKLMYGAASMNNAGISKENLAKIDDKINEFNLRNESREFKSFGEYFKTRRGYKKEIKALRKVEGMSVFDRILKKISGIFTYDLKKFNGYRTNSKFTTMLNKIPVGIRGKSGLVLKFVVFMFAIQPLIDGVLHKCCNAIFGKDYDPMIEDDQKAAKKEQMRYTKEDLHKRLLEAQALKQNSKTELSEKKEITTKNQTDILSETEEEDPRLKVIEQNMQQEHINVQPTKTEENSILQSYEQNIPKENLPQNADTDSEVQTQNTEIVTEAQSQKAEQNIQREVVKINKENVNSIPDIKHQTQLQQDRTVRDNYSYIPSSENKYKNSEIKKQNKTDNYTYIPSSDNTIKGAEKDSVNKYIPAQTAGKFSNSFDNSGLNDALQRADRAEQRALKILAGNFE